MDEHTLVPYTLIYIYIITLQITVYAMQVLCAESVQDGIQYSLHTNNKWQTAAIWLLYNICRIKNYVDVRCSTGCLFLCGPVKRPPHLVIVRPLLACIALHG